MTQQTNPTNEQELREQVLTEFKQVHKLAPADYTENCTNVVMSIIQAHINAEIAKVKLEDTKRLTKLARILKRYNVLWYVNAYNEAIRRDWQDIRLPVARDATLYEPSELESELKEVK